jgi:hypothetical protein
VPILGITTPVEFAEAEWDKLARGWKGLNPTERDKRLQAHLDELRDAGQLPSYPEIPGWQDIIKTGRAPANLTKAELAVRRKLVIARINRSITPPSQRALSSILTAIDDVQDLASFAGLVSRLIIRAAPRVLGRFVPVVGWIMTAADVLNFLTLITTGMGAVIGLQEGGPLGAAASQGAQVFTKIALKRELWRALRRTPIKAVRRSALSGQLTYMFSTKYKLPYPVAQKYAAIVGRRVGIGELIEAGQAVQTLTGYGLSLGALMGYLSDWAWANYRDISTGRGPIYTALAKEIGKQAPAEFILDELRPQPVPFDFSKRWGLGPAYESYLAHQFPTKPPPPYSPDLYAFVNHLGYYNLTGFIFGPLDLTDQPDAALDTCVFTLWPGHPDYPLQPNSIVFFDAQPRAIVARLWDRYTEIVTHFGLIPLARATVGHR